METKQDLASQRSPLATQRILFAGFVFRMISSVVILATLGRILRPEDYGYFSLVATLTFVIREALELGVGTLVTREIVKDPQREQFMIEGLMGWRAWVSAFLSGALLLFALVQEDPARAWVIVGLAIITPTYIVLAEVPSFVARQAMVGPAVLSMVLQVFVLTGMFTMDWLGFTGVVFCWLIILRELATNAGYHMMFRKLVRFNPRLVPVNREIRQFLYSAFVYSGAALLHNLYFSLDVFLVYWIRGEAELGAYSAAFRIINPVLELPYMLAIPLVPALTRLAHLELPRLKTLITDLFWIALAVGLVATLAGIVTARDFIEILYGGNYLEGDLDASGSFAWLSVALCATCISAPLVIGLLALHLERQLLVIGAMGFIMNLTANLLLLPFFGFEVAAMTTAMTEIAVCLLMIRAIQKNLGMDVFKGWPALLAPGVAVGAILFVIDLAPLFRILIGVLLGVMALVMITRFPSAVRAREAIDEATLSGNTDSD